MQALFKDLFSVFDAIKKGDISTAQKALTTFQSDKAGLEGSAQTSVKPQLPPASQAYFDSLDG